MDYVEIRAQVSGYLTEIHFTDGQIVHKGDLLFIIDPRPYQIQLAMLGFSLNNLSLFGLVLAVGIVVDDAIVVAENVERNLRRGPSPREAAHHTIDEVGGALIAIALTLCAVFIPSAFISGISGLFFGQFAVTISASPFMRPKLNLESRHNFAEAG